MEPCFFGDFPNLMLKCMVNFPGCSENNFVHDVWVGIKEWPLFITYTDYMFRLGANPDLSFLHLPRYAIVQGNLKYPPPMPPPPRNKALLRETILGGGGIGGGTLDSHDLWQFPSPMGDFFLSKLDGRFWQTSSRFFFQNCPGFGRRWQIILPVFWVQNQNNTHFENTSPVFKTVIFSFVETLPSN